MIKWSVELKTIKDLKDFEHNPRRINKKQYENLVRSLKEDGYHQLLLVNTDNTIIGGHQRKKALLEAGYKENDQIPVRVPSSPLCVDILKRINIRDNLPYGEFNYEILANEFEFDDLVDWGFAPEWLLHEEVVEEEKEANDEDSNSNQARKARICPNCGYNDDEK